MRPQPRFSKQVATPTVPPPESLAWWWHPGRAGVRVGPPTVRRKLAEVDPNLEITWNAYANHWSLWLRRPSMSHPICWGWNLLFNVAPERLGDGSAVLARLYSASARAFGGAKQYFDAIQREEERDAAAREAARQFEAVEDGWDRIKKREPWVGSGTSRNANKVS